VTAIFGNMRRTSIREKVTTALPGIEQDAH